MSAEGSNDGTMGGSTTTMAANTVAEAVKRYTFPVMAVIFVNNSLRPQEAVTIMDSFHHHIGTITHLNLSKNNLGLPGAQYLEDVIMRMQSIK